VLEFSGRRGNKPILLNSSSQPPVDKSRIARKKTNFADDNNKDLVSVQHFKESPRSSSDRKSSKSGRSPPKLKELKIKTS
jgi:hypothetical protein